MSVLQGLRAGGTHDWTDGTVYNPDDGLTYRAAMAIQEDGDLWVRGYLLLPILGRTHVWTRVR